MGLLAIAVCILKGASALDCKTCEAKDYASCSSAPSVTCPEPDVDGEGTLKEWACGSMEHRRQGSKVDHVILGCRQKEACEADEAQNYSSNNNKGKQQCWATDARKVSKSDIAAPLTIAILLSLQLVMPTLTINSPG